MIEWDKQKCNFKISKDSDQICDLRVGVFDKHRILELHDVALYRETVHFTLELSCWLTSGLFEHNL